MSERKVLCAASIFWFPDLIEEMFSITSPPRRQLFRGDRKHKQLFSRRREQLVSMGGSPTGIAGGIGAYTESGASSSPTGPRGQAHSSASAGAKLTSSPKVLRTDAINLDFLLTQVMGGMQQLDWNMFTRNERTQVCVDMCVLERGRVQLAGRVHSQ